MNKRKTNKAKRRINRLKRKEKRAKDRLIKIKDRKTDVEKIIEERNEHVRDKAIEVKGGRMGGRKLASLEQVEEMQKRLGALETHFERTKIEVGSLREEVEEMDEYFAKELDDEDERRSLSDLMVSDVGKSIMAGIQAVIGAVNTGGQPYNRNALAAARTLRVLAESEVATPSARAWTQVFATLAEAFAFWDPEAGIRSVLGQDAPPALEERLNLLVPVLDRLVSSMEGIHTALNTEEPVSTSLMRVSQNVTEINRSFGGHQDPKQPALVPLVQHLNEQIENIADKYSNS